MFMLLYGLVAGMLVLAGAAVLLALTRLVLVQVRAVTRLTRQLAGPHDRPAAPWEFTDCASPPGWLLPPLRQRGELLP
ncbi:MAG TPA: hypothetical protein VFA45_21630 [Actinomycetes bacterium]|jgi:hypothetical protein|nr:hypothetical protein [Actinomycetes bacterium]